MGSMAYQITTLTIVYSAFYSGADQWKHQSSASRALGGEFTGAGEFPAQMASNAENVSIWWRHHEPGKTLYTVTIKTQHTVGQEQISKYNRIS